MFRMGLLSFCVLASLQAILNQPPSFGSKIETPIDSMMHTIAHMNFPMDLATGKIKLPQTIKNVVIDVGARESDYLERLELTNDEETAIFLFDPQPSSGVQLAERVAKFSLRGIENTWLDPLKSNQAFYTKAALGENEGITEFNVAWAPACSSLPAESDENDFWCAKSSRKITVTVLTLAGFLPLIDKKVVTTAQHGGNHNSTGVEQIHLKIDAEGADLMVLRGARDFLRMCDTVVIECQRDGGKSKRKSECVTKDAVAYMDTLGFKLYEVEGQGGLVNIFWVHPEYQGPVPEFLKGRVSFRKFYSAIDGWVAAKYSPVAKEMSKEYTLYSDGVYVVQ